MTESRVLEVLLHGEPVGTLSRAASDRLLFAFSSAYAADEDRPTLGLGLRDRFGKPIARFPATSVRALPFFSNLLPEGRMRRYLARRAGANPEREYFLLQALGADLSGAAVLRAADGGSPPPAADAAESGAAPEPDGGARGGPLRFSLAGVQVKFSAAAQPGGGLTVPASGMGGSWIVKLPAREFDGVPENEFAMLELARRLGMDVPRARLVPVADVRGLPADIGRFGGRALAVERFDRLPGGARVHTEDFAQVFGVYPEKKYDAGSARRIAAVIGAECGDDDIVEFVRRLTFNTLIGNADMHLKNWSLIYPDRRRPMLAPAYDLVSTIAWLPDETAALKFSRTRRFAEYAEDELAHLAARSRLPEKVVLDTARLTTEAFLDLWRAEKAHLPLSAAAVRAIDAQLRLVPLSRVRAVALDSPRGGATLAPSAATGAKP